MRRGAPREVVSDGLKVGFVSSSDPGDIRSWSGTNYFMWRSLREAGLTLDVFGPIEPRLPARVWARRIFYKWFSSSSYLYDRDPEVGRRYAAEVARRTSSSRCDLVFSVGGHPVAYLETDVPVVYWADATFHAMVGFYPEYSNLSERSERDGNAMEAAALRRSTFAIFASDWAARSAIDDYGVRPTKVRVVPFGANLDRALTEDEVRNAVSSRPRDVCRLLFIGVDWSRKGGDVAVAIAGYLNNEGIPTELTIVGCVPRLSESSLRFTRIYGTLDKTSPKGRADLAALLSRSHFLLLPSRAECYGVVLCEANAYGVPCLTTNVGGISTIIRQDVNGRMFEVDEPPREWASHAAALFSAPKAYRELALSAHTEYRKRLNWAVSADAVKRLLQEI